MAASRSAALRRPPAQIRWDRVGRVALLVVLVGVIALYVNPARDLLTAWGENKDRQAEVTRLERDNAGLRERQRLLRDPRALEREARNLGMVRPDERPFVVEGLPRSGTR